MRSIPVPGNANFDHLLMVMSVKFHHSKITGFSSVISKYLVWKYFEAIEIVSCFSSFDLFILVSTDKSCQVWIFLI